jgi:phosphinothricin acetyltransferase
MPIEYTIRLAEETDLEQFAEIVNHYIETTAINFHDRPQSEEDWEATWQVLHEQYPFLVAEKEGVLGGIAYASPWKLRGSYGWTCEVTVYVRAGHERQGLGKALSKRMLDILEAQGYRAIVAVIALPNEASVALHKSLGYEHAGTLKNLGFKLDQWRDVSFWQVNFGDPEAAPSEIKPVSEVVGIESDGSEPATTEPA